MIPPRRLLLVLCLGLVGGEPQATKDDIDDLKHFLQDIKVNVEIFNTVYLKPLLEKLSELVLAVSNVDANVKHLQGRAHVWDTLQHHVAAWNDQMKTLDRKVDLLGGAEKKEDQNENFLVGVEVKLERVAEKMEDVRGRLAGVEKLMAASGERPLVTEFAGKGVLSTLKDIDEATQALKEGQAAIKSASCPEGRLTTDLQEWRTEDLHLHRSTKEHLERLERRILDDSHRHASSFSHLTHLSDLLLGNLTETHRTLDSHLACCNDQTHSLSGFRASADFRLAQLDEALRTHEHADEKRLGATLGHFSKHVGEVLRRIDAVQLKMDLACREEQPTPAPRESDEGESAESATWSPEALEGCAHRRIKDDPVGQRSGVIQMKGQRRSWNYYTRYCDQETDGGGWTVIQRRRDFGEPRQNFTLSWDDYKKGFGDLEREFWFGNDFVHRMTSEEPYVLRVDLADFEGNRAYAQYSVFIVGSGEEGYPLKVEGYEGNGTDSLSAHSGSKFSTWDRDNDDAPECCPCAPAYGGGWWFYSCFESNLNGQFFPDPTENGYYQGIIWEHWKGDYSLASSEMKIRPKWFHSLMESGAFADAPADGDTATTTPWWVGLGISPVPDP